VGKCNVIAINVSIDATRAQFLLDQVGKDIPFVLATSINAVRNEAQIAVQQRVETAFTIAPSRLPFMLRLVKRTGTATKAKPVAELSITGPTGKSGRGRAGLLARHVVGGVHAKADPNHPFFIPSDVLRPGPFDVAPRNLFPSALRLINSRGIDGGLLPLKTNKGGQIANTKRVRIAGRTGRGSTEVRSFFVAPLNNRNGRTPGIYERVRVGPDKGDLQLLWLYRARINLGAPLLPFYTLVGDVVHARFQLLMEQNLRKLIVSAQ
jgi:hypothetical protein